MRTASLFIPTPISTLSADFLDDGLSRLHWLPDDSERQASRRATETRTQISDSIRRFESALRADIDEYFSGRPSSAFPRITLSASVLNNGTAFQRNVRLALSAIPFGETRTYAQIAACCEHPGAARAVGSVCRNNPFPLIIPCHRVIRSDGIGQYAGSDTFAFIKQKLLNYEAGQSLTDC